MREKKPNILFVSHDCNRAGAQLFLFNIAEYFKLNHYKVSLLFISSYGNLQREFQEKFNCYFLDDQPKPQGINNFFTKKSDSQNTLNFVDEILQKNNIDLIYINTIASVGVIDILNKSLAKIPVLTHIHELEHSMQIYSNQVDRNLLRKHSDKIIACSQAVKDNLVNAHNIKDESVEVVHSFIDNEAVLRAQQKVDKTKAKKKFNFPTNKYIVGGCGNAEWRKGVDVFVMLANEIIKKDKDLHFVWIGMKQQGEFYDQIKYDIEKMGIESHVSLIPPIEDPIEAIDCLDAFLVSSREDPFPLVMLEAALCGKPILGFHNTGGCSEFIQDKNGLLSPYLDISDMCSKLIQLKNHKNESISRGEHAKNDVLTKYSFGKSIKKIELIVNQMTESAIEA